MWTLFRKEIKEFFSSITGYLVVVVYLVINSLIMWIFHGPSNILDAGQANLDPLFIISPWVFLFLVPAVTMRLISEEKRLQTMELLLVRPISEFKITMAKYLSGLSLVLVALLPTLVYTISINQLGRTEGIADMGGIAGSYIGLFFLAAIYTAIGLFASSLSNNQIISFIIAVVLSFGFYIGFDQVAGLGLNGAVEDFIMSLGINYHYKAISKGVIDTRDILYFLSVITVFILLTKLRLERRKWK
ncbi:MAG: gliding motility-associated ABC transporter permease subunit GldF [Bacteroidales bacterium]|jgi:ABC-2 type transport system permease protein|nr:gliding motility-associated ABC transporter permease subunit GldF [Bacteroidales bacterium]